MRNKSAASFTKIRFTFLKRCSQQVLEREYNREYWLDLHGLDIEKLKPARLLSIETVIPQKLLCRRFLILYQKVKMKDSAKKTVELYELAPKPNDNTVE